MRRDTIFYQLFRQSPTLLFELLPEIPERSAEYVFDSVEVKETSFRIDGVFLPPDPSGIVFFCEVQFQLDELLASGRITPIYLGEMPRADDLPIGLGLMILTTLEGDEAKNEARRLIGQADGNSDIIGLVSTIVLYKFNSLSRDEVDMMLGIELQQTRVYQEAKAEGRAEGKVEGEQVLVLKLLARKFGKIDDLVQSQIGSLLIDQVESLGEALLDFTNMDDLMAWLDKINMP